MPTYDYICQSCKNNWEDFRSISNRKEPEGEPCPKCGVTGHVEQSIVLSPIAMSVTLESTRAMKKLNNSHFAEKLNEIHRNTPGSNLDKSSTIVEVK